MQHVIRCLWFLILVSSFKVLAAGSEVNTPLPKPLDPSDFASLQRGARTFFNYCSGCHSLKYERYNGLAKGIGIVDENGKVLEKTVESNLIFTGQKITDAITVAMTSLEAEKWFGVPPPDLSLTSRSRGNEWLYGYLTTYYPDPTRPWGVNNKVYPNTAMPHVLEHMQNTQTKEEYEQTIYDLVNFLNYVGEPHQVFRKHLGVAVVVLLAIIFIFAALLKREYWKDVD